MAKISKNPVKLLRYENHGETMATALASNLRHSAFADVKIICADGSAWAHRLVLAAVSPVLRHVFFDQFHHYFVFRITANSSNCWKQ